ncbi:MAG: cytochrome [Gammaproteobacteria bacterium]|nr:MAG: cytochrome [Gammaproteobacteria bacterium]
MSSSAKKPYYSPFDKSFIDDPFPTYTQLRNYGPIYQDEELGYYVVSRYDEVKQIALDTKNFSSAKGILLSKDENGQLIQDASTYPPSIIQMDPPVHSQFRSLVSKAFNTKQMATLEPIVKSISQDLLDDLAGQTEIDFNLDYGNILPVTVICDMLGCEKKHRHVFKKAADALVYALGASQAETLAARQALGELLQEQIELKKKHPDKGLISALLNASVDGKSLSAAELSGFVSILMAAGTETTTNLISNTLVYMHHHPEVKQRLLDDPTKISGAVDEFLRLESPVQGLSRTVVNDVIINGQTLAKDSKVLLLFASANRDETAYENPTLFDENRPGKKHLALGHGIHLCLGAHLARLEAKVALTDLLARVPDYTLNLDQAVRVPTVIIRGFEKLPATIHTPIVKSKSQQEEPIPA